MKDITLKETAVFINECFGLFKSSKLNEWKEKIKGEVEEYQPGRLFFYPVGNRQISSVTVGAEENGDVAYVYFYFAEKVDNSELWPDLKKQFSADFKLDEEVTGEFMLSTDVIINNIRFVIKAGFSEDPNAGKIFHLNGLQFERFKFIK